MATSTNIIDQDKVRIGTQVSYGSGQIAGQIFRDIPSLLLLFFMTNVLGISPAVAGTAIFAPKLFAGAISDLTVGVIIDRMRERIPLYWWLLFGAITAPIAMILLFNVPSMEMSHQVWYIVAIVTLYMFIFASFSVPYLAIAAALSNNSHQRTVLMAWRLVFTALGILVAGGVAPAFVAQMGGKAPAYSAMSLLLAALCFISLIIAFIGSRKAIKSQKVEIADELRTHLSLSQMIKATKSPKFSVLLLVNTLQLCGTGMTYAAMLYFLTYVMKLSDPLTAIGGIILATTLGIIIAQPFWVKLAKRIGKKKVYIIGTIFHALSLSAWALTAEKFGMPGAIILSVFIGIGNSGWVMLGFSMVTDLAEDGKAGLFSSLWIAADKIGFAIGGTLLIGLILSGFGFDSSKAVAGLAQTDMAINGVKAAFALIPAAIYILGAVIYFFLGTETSVDAKP